MDMFEFNDRLKSFSAEDEIRRVLHDNEDAIVKLNQDALFKGEDAKGDIIGVYSPFTEKITKGTVGRGYPKEANKPYNLFASGKLHNSITTNYKDGVITFISVDNNLPDILNTIKKHGLIDNPKDTLFGLDVKDGEIVSFNILFPELNNRLKRKLGN